MRSDRSYASEAILTADLLEIRGRGKSFRVAPGRNREFWNEANSGVWEPETYETFERFIRPDRDYIDIGSWIGPTVLFGCQFARRAFAVEPDPVAFADLSANVSANPFSNIQLFNGCIAEKSGKVAFGSQGDGGDSMSSMLFASGKTRWTVDALSFDDFLRAHQVGDVGFLKMDIEGGEYGVLPTMLPYLQKHRPTLHLSLHPCFLAPGDNLSYLGKLRRAGETLGPTLELLRSLGFYRNIFDTHGRKLGLAAMALLCCKAAFSVIATDSDWTPVKVAA